MLGILVFFHELGHFTVAKLLKIRVEEFAFGFGPKWIRLFKKGDTEYTIRPIPLGGFVKLAGENPDETDVPGGFHSKPWYQRFVVYLAGPLASFLLAYFIFCTLGMTMGLPITGKALNQVDLVMPSSRAEKAGLRIGDRILAIGDVKVRTGNQLVDIIHNSPDKLLDLHVERDGQILTLQGTPKPTTIKDRNGKDMKVGLLGFVPRQELTRVGIRDSVKYGTMTTVRYVETLVVVLFSKDVAKNVGGPIAIADETSKSVKRGPNGFIQLIAMLSLSLGIFNLMPIPIVDGGQMVLSVIEGIKGGKLSQKTLVVAQLIGFAVIAFIFVSIMYLDLQRVLTHQMFQ
jgi:regulator of sigma E protease